MDKKPYGYPIINDFDQDWYLNLMKIALPCMKSASTSSYRTAIQLTMGLAFVDVPFVFGIMAWRSFLLEVRLPRLQGP